MDGGPRSATARRAASVASCRRVLGEACDPGCEVGHAEPPADHVLGGVQAGVDGALAHPDRPEAGRPQQGLERGGVLDRARRSSLSRSYHSRGDEPEPLRGGVHRDLGRVRRSGRERAGHDRPRHPPPLAERGGRIVEVAQAEPGGDQVEGADPRTAAEPRPPGPPGSPEPAGRASGQRRRRRPAGAHRVVGRRRRPRPCQRPRPVRRHLRAAPGSRRASPRPAGA